MPQWERGGAIQGRTTSTGYAVGLKYDWAETYPLGEIRMQHASRRMYPQGISEGSKDGVAVVLE